MNFVARTMLVLLGAIIVTGCGSSRIYTTDKTLEYQGTIYNISDVKQLSTRLEALPASGEAIDLRAYDARKFDALVKDNGPVVVRSIIAMDDTTMVYEQKAVERGRDFDRMKSALGDAYGKLARFMADGKKTQLKL